MNIQIVGAGMAGLIAANMLRRHNIEIGEKADSLPNNHTAVLRFRTTAVSDATGIPFTKEIVHKGLLKDFGLGPKRVVNEATIEDMNKYSLMVTGGHLFTRSIFNLKPGERWCAPRDFIQQMARNLNIKFGAQFKYNPDYPIDTPLISTIPMPFMMDMFRWRERPVFKWLPVWTMKCTMHSPMSNVCHTLYRTEKNSWYRATLHGQELTLEFMFQPSESNDLVQMNNALGCFGFDLTGWHNNTEQGDSWGWNEQISINKIPIGKILPIDETVRKRFLLWLTEKHNIYSLGRFATWRNILLDDIVHDVKRIESMIEKRTTYEMR